MSRFKSIQNYIYSPELNTQELNIIVNKSNEVVNKIKTTDKNIFSYIEENQEQHSTSFTDTFLIREGLMSNDFTKNHLDFINRMLLNPDISMFNLNVIEKFNIIYSNINCVEHRRYIRETILGCDGFIQLYDNFPLISSLSFFQMNLVEYDFFTIGLMKEALQNAFYLSDKLLVNPSLIPSVVGSTTTPWVYEFSVQTSLDYDTLKLDMFKFLFNNFENQSSFNSNNGKLFRGSILIEKKFIFINEYNEAFLNEKLKKTLKLVSINRFM